MVMTEEQTFRFALTGFLVRPSVLSADEVAALREQVDRVFDDWEGLPPEQRLPAGASSGLIDHPQVIDILHEVVGPDIRLEGMFPVDYAGRDTPEWMQGRSFRPNLTGDTPADWPTSLYYRYWMHMAHHAVPAHYGLRTDRYKLIFFYGLALDASYSDHPPTEIGWELYDLDSGPGELRNVYEDPAYQEVVVDLKLELERLKRHYGDTDDRYPELLARWRRARRRILYSKKRESSR